MNAAGRFTWSRSLLQPASLLLICIPWLGCSDDETPGTAPTVDSGIAFDLGPQDTRVEITLSPTALAYDPSDTPKARARAYDLNGDAIEDPEFVWRVEPLDLGLVERDGTVRFGREGSGFLEACTTGGCGRIALVINYRPTLSIETPARGSMQGGSDNPIVQVRGTAADPSGQFRVRVNGELADVDSSGQFTAEITPQFGVNRLEVRAYDDVHPEPTTQTWAYLWAPQYRPIRPDGITLDGLLTARLDQVLVDSNVPLAPWGAEFIEIADFAQLVSVILRTSRITDLLPDPQIINSAMLAVRLEDLDVGTPDVELEIGTNGVDLDIYLPSVRVQTSGLVNFEGQQLSLDGLVHVEMGLFARFLLDIRGGLDITIEQFDVRVDSIRGDFAEPGINGLLAALDSRLHDVVEGAIQEIGQGLLLRELPQLLTIGYDQLLSLLSNIPVGLDPGIPGVSPVNLLLDLEPYDVTLNAREDAQLYLRANIDHAVPPPPTNAPGCPSGGPIQPRRTQGQGLGVVMGVDIINALCFEIWRTGVFSTRPALPPPFDAFGQIELEALMPPIVVPTAAQGNAFEITLAELQMSIVRDGDPEPDVYVLSIRAGLQGTAHDGFVGVELIGEPMIEAELLSQGSPAPLGADQLAGLITGVIWPQVRSVVDSGLEYGIEPIVLGAEDLSLVAPQLAELRFAPRLQEGIRLDEGVLLFEGQVIMSARIFPEQ